MDKCKRCLGSGEYYYAAQCRHPGEPPKLWSRCDCKEGKKHLLVKALAATEEAKRSIETAPFSVEKRAGDASSLIYTEKRYH